MGAESPHVLRKWSDGAFAEIMLLKNTLAWATLLYGVSPNYTITSENGTTISRLTCPVCDLAVPTAMAKEHLRECFKTFDQSEDATTV
jgi:hypothetical protein